MNNKLLFGTAILAASVLTGCVKKPDNKVKVKIIDDSVSCSLKKIDLRVDKGTPYKDILAQVKGVSASDGYMLPYYLHTEDSKVILSNDFTIEENSTFVVSALKKGDFSIVSTTATGYVNEDVVTKPSFDILMNSQTKQIYISLSDLYPYDLFPEIPNSKGYTVGAIENDKVVVTNVTNPKITDATATFDFNAQEVTFNGFEDFFYTTYPTSIDTTTNALDICITQPSHWISTASVREYDKGHATTLKLREYGVSVIKYENKFYVSYDAGMNALFDSNGGAMIFDGVNKFYRGSTYNENIEQLKVVRDSFKTNKAFNEYTLTDKYNALALQIDLIFGVPSRIARDPKLNGKVYEYNKDGAYNLLKSYKAQLLSGEPDSATLALQNIIGNELDDGGHTTYSSNVGNMLATEYGGLAAMNDNDHIYKLMFGTKAARKAAGFEPTGMDVFEGSAGYSEMEEGGQKIAYITFDSFSALQINPAEVNETNYTLSTTALVYWADKNIREHNIKNVVIDLTCNTGGLPDAAFEIQAWCNKGKADFSLFSTVSESFLHCEEKLDLNQDGIADERDYLPDDVNVYCITSNCSYSCGNALPVALRKGEHSRNKVKFIGDKTGGGCCTPGQFSTGYGDYWRLARGIVILGYQGTKENRIPNEDGVPLSEYFLNYHVSEYHVDPNDSRMYTISDFAKFFDRATINKAIVNAK